MHIRKRVRLAAFASLAAAATAALLSQRPVSAADNTGSISGVVTSAKGPEAGVWVIAESDDFRSRFRKIVVTDERGRFLLPELPKDARYQVWVRGYGLTDSTPVSGRVDRTLNLTAVLAKTPLE
ncbi:MAG: carboxypeptidase-like regulatory domain-containing protein, partial [Vicinamibacterales bacterium]